MQHPLSELEPPQSVESDHTRLRCLRAVNQCPSGPHLVPLSLRKSGLCTDLYPPFTKSGARFLCSTHRWPTKCLQFLQRGLSMCAPHRVFPPLLPSPVLHGAVDLVSQIPEPVDCRVQGKASKPPVDECWRNCLACFQVGQNHRVVGHILPALLVASQVCHARMRASAASLNIVNSASSLTASCQALRACL